MVQWSDIGDSSWLNLAKYLAYCAAALVFWIVVDLLPPLRANEVAFCVLNLSLLLVVLPCVLFLISFAIYPSRNFWAMEFCLVPSILLSEVLNLVPANPFALGLPYFHLLEASILCTLGNFKRAEYSARRALVLFQQDTALNPTLKLWSLSGLTSALQGQGRYCETKALIDQMFEIVNSNRNNDESRASALAEFSSNLVKMGRTKEAIECGRNAVSLFSTRIYDQKDERFAELALALGRLGIAYSQAGEHQLALESYEKSLVLRLQIFGPNRLETYYSYNNVGSALIELGRYDQALEKIEKARQILLDCGRKNGSTWASVMTNLGNLHRATGNFDQSERELSEALSIRSKRFKEELHDCHHALGKLYRDKGDFERARDYLTKALTVREQRYGEHPETAQTLKEFAQLMRLTNNITEAQQMESRAEAILSASRSSP